MKEMSSKAYIDGRGWKYRVMPGLGEGAYKARYQKENHHGGGGWKCVAALPWRGSSEEAQADLDRLAVKKGWSEWKGETGS